MMVLLHAVCLHERIYNLSKHLKSLRHACQIDLNRSEFAWHQQGGSPMAYLDACLNDCLLHGIMI